MEKIIDAFENEIESLKNSIKANREMLKIIANPSTSPIYEAIIKLEGSLDWHNGELYFLKSYSPCTCSKLWKSIRLFNTEHQVYSYATMYQCKKCSGYFSK